MGVGRMLHKVLLTPPPDLGLIFHTSTSFYTLLYISQTHISSIVLFFIAITLCEYFEDITWKELTVCTTVLPYPIIVPRHQK
ncbi:hypothetical protein L873DRAFT_1821698, partial [Choiromyces venosus 120613-1]